MTSLTRSAVAALALLAEVAAVHAAVIPFGSRAAFDAAFPGSVLENWDGFAAGTTFANGSTANGVTYNSSTNVAVVTNAFLTTSGPNGLGRTPDAFFLGSDTITFSFASGLFAFGIDINTFATTAGAYEAATNLGDIVFSVFNPFPGFETGQFVAFSSDTPFTSVTISANTADSYTLDTLRGAAVPEPGTLALVVLALLGAARWSRRRQATPA